jgi:hypothetical protein
MKRSLILTLALVFCLGILSSCSRKCKGGGWYGNRNLGYVPQESKVGEAADLASIYTTEEECEEAAD